MEILVKIYRINHHWTIKYTIEGRPTNVRREYLQVVAHYLQQPFGTTNNKNTNTINNKNNKESTIETSKLRQKKSKRK